MLWSSYFPLCSRKNTAEGYTRHLESLRDILGAYTERSTLAASPQKSERTKELGTATDPTCMEFIPLISGTRLVDLEKLLPIVDGHIVTLTNPHRDLLMLHCFLIRVLRMAGRAGGDIPETFDSDDEVSLLAASNAGSTEEQTAHELIQLPLYYDRTTDLEKSSLAPSP